MENLEQTLTLIEVIVAAVVILTPLVAALIGTTAWGKKNKASLDVLVGAVGQIRQQGGTVENVTTLMKAKETLEKPPVVKTWKAAVKRHRAKGGR